MQYAASSTQSTKIINSTITYPHVVGLPESIAALMENFVEYEPKALCVLPGGTKGRILALRPAS